MSKSSNADQKDYWSGPSGESWITHQDAQDRLLRTVNDVILKAAGLSEGDRVVDIGCGAGALSVDAAKIVGRHGFLLATDISEPLLNHTAARLQDVPRAETLCADAADADWPAPPFDHAISRFGVMFFADPPAAFAHLATALRAGGKMTFAAWAPARENPYWTGAQSVAVRHLGKPPRIEQDTPGPMGLADRGLAKKRVEAGGLADVSVTATEVELTFAEGPQALSRLLMNIGPAARVARIFEATDAQEHAIRSDLEDWLAGYSADGVVRIPAVINLIEARRP